MCGTSKVLHGCTKAEQMGHDICSGLETLFLLLKLLIKSQLEHLMPTTTL